MSPLTDSDASRKRSNVHPADRPNKRIREGKADRFERHYHEARSLFDGGDIREAAGELEKLLEEILREVVIANNWILSGKERYDSALTDESGERRALEQLTFRDLCGLFDTCSVILFDHDEKAKQDKYHERLRRYKKNKELLRTFRFEAIPDLLSECKNTQDKNDDTVRLGVQQVLCCVVALLQAHEENMLIGAHYHFLTNYRELEEEFDQIRDSNRKLTGLETKLEFLNDD